MSVLIPLPCGAKAVLFRFKSSGVWMELTIRFPIFVTTRFPARSVEDNS